MKFLNALLFFTFLCGYSFGQNIKYFLDDQNDVCDSAKASAYMILYQKKESDSVFKMNEYTIDGLLLAKISFKDVNFSILHGQSEYYKAVGNNSSELTGNIDTTYHKPDESYLQTKGNYILGKKNGIWTEYTKNGNVKKIETYVDNVLNGKYIDYDNNGDIIVSGECINGLREGRWAVFGGSQDDIYEHGRVIKIIKNKAVTAEKDEAYKEKTKYDVPPDEPAGFNSDLSRFMGIANSNRIRLETAVVSFTINADGTISDTKVIGVSDFTLRKKIEDYFVKSKGWKPATEGKEKKPVKSMFRYQLRY